jgi:hypothetical protein
VRTVLGSKPGLDSSGMTFASSWANPPCSASLEVLPGKLRRHAEKIHAFIPGFEPDGELLLRGMATVSIQLMLLCALLYALIFWPQAETGLYSLHPVKRVLILIFLPLSFSIW